MSHESFEDVRTRVLTDNTAQGVLNHLKALDSNRAHVLTRWVWELLQNARDASTSSDTGLVASIEHTEDDLVFRHNGAYFKIDEIAHLIYHGSTKIENTETIGQYGSGFLTTHLLSPEIDVYGHIDDGRKFEFHLKRTVESVSGLSKSMERAWSDFEESLSDTAGSDDFTTEFRYPLKDDAHDAVEKGLATLKLCAPFLFVFNREFSSIAIKYRHGAVEFKAIERKQLEGVGLKQVTVEERENGNLRKTKYFLAQGEKASVSIPLGSGDDGECLVIDEIPRLFLGFPLVGTENFSFPAVINSTKFTPTENRDGVYLGQSDNEANIQNQAVIEEACTLLVRMLQFAASSGWHNAYVLANVPDIHGQDWLNSDWLRQCLKERLVKEIRQNAVVLNEAWETMPPNSLKLPVADADDAVVGLWDLLDGWQHARWGLPRRDESLGWCQATKSWAGISSCEVSEFDEVTDGRKLAEQVHEASHDPSANTTTHRINSLGLKEGVEEIQWLDQLIAFLNDNGLSAAIREYRVVPSQARFLRTLPTLHRDCGIDEELKNIAGLLDWHIRLELRDNRVTSLDDEPGAGDRDRGYVVGEIIKKLRDRSEKTPDDNFRQASVRLFTWIAAQEDWDLLRGFPAFAEQSDSGSGHIIKLDRVEGSNDRPLAPIRAWPEDLRRFSDIFPPTRILADDFFEKVPKPKPR